jgi:hypothetical protein
MQMNPMQMNPMQMNPMQMSQMNQMQNNYGNDVNMSVEKMLEERKNIDNMQSMNNNQNNFNPMMNPMMNQHSQMNTNSHMNNNTNNNINQLLALQQMQQNMYSNNNHLNFNRVAGGQQTNSIDMLLDSLSDEQLDKQIRSLREKIESSIQLTDLSLPVLQGLSSKELDVIINNINGNLTRNQLEVLGLDNITPNMYEDIAKSEPVIEEYQPKNKINNTPTTEPVEENTQIEHKLVIEADEFVEPEHYNEIYYEFQDPLNTVVGVEIENIDIKPPKIEIYNSSFVFKVNDVMHSIDVPYNMYTYNELVKTINDSLNEYNIQFRIGNTNYVTIKSNNGFEIINDDESVLRYLGFIQDEYSGTNIYRSDTCLTYPTIYIFIDKLDNRHSLIEYDMNKKFEPIYKKIYAKRLEDFVISYRTGSTIDSDMYNFNNESHSITINLYTE